MVASDPVSTINAVANLAIVVGYVLVPLLWLPYLPLTRSVLYAGVVFFVTCAMTHLAMAFGFVHSPWMTVNHVIQAAAVLTFVLGFGRLLRRASTFRRPGQVDLRRAEDPDDPQVDLAAPCDVLRKAPPAAAPAVPPEAPREGYRLPGDDDAH